MNTIFIIITLVVLFCLLYYRFYDTMNIRSDVDGNYYKIRGGKGRDVEHLQKSADTLAQINNKVERLIIYLNNKYKDDPQWNFRMKKLRQNYNNNVLSEAAIDERYTTFTVDKTQMHICLRTRDSYESIYNIDLLMYVVLHELGHMCNYTENDIPIVGHGSEFRDIFELLVKNAIEIDIYNYKDYSHEPMEYCGIMISSNVYKK